MQSCIYEGTITHRRHSPIQHEFDFGLYLLYLDLDELDEVFGGRWLWSHRRPAAGWLRREDHFGDPEQPLIEAVRDEVARHTGARPVGPVRLLTHLRYMGYVFNPLSLYYCFGSDGERLEAVVAEVTSTPWKERHCYVLDLDESMARMGAHSVEARKQMHVSPFMEMGLAYTFGLAAPDRRLSFAIECRKPGERPVFDASMLLHRHEISTRALMGVGLRYPFMTAQVMAGIHWQALKLWWKGARFHPHPGSGSEIGRARDERERSRGQGHRSEPQVERLARPTAPRRGAGTPVRDLDRASAAGGRR